MSRFLVIILLFIGAFYIFFNQEDVVDSVRAFLKLDNGNNIVKNAIKERQDAIDYAERKYYGR